MLLALRLVSLTFNMAWSRAGMAAPSGLNLPDVIVVIAVVPRIGVGAHVDLIWSGLWYAFELSWTRKCVWDFRRYQTSTYLCVS